MGIFFSVVRIQISNADLVLKNGDTEQALTILRQITPQQRFLSYSLNFEKNLLNKPVDKCNFFDFCYCTMVPSI